MKPPSRSPNIKELHQDLRRLSRNSHAPSIHAYCQWMKSKRGTRKIDSIARGIILFQTTPQDHPWGPSAFEGSGYRRERLRIDGRQFATDRPVLSFPINSVICVRA
jgi:hypothetical protein